MTAASAPLNSVTSPWVVTEMARLAEYADKYAQVAFGRDDGILLMRLHSDGGPLVWDGRAHAELGLAFADVASDHRNEVVILTGTGTSFIADVDMGEESSISGATFARLFRDGRRLVTNLLEIEVPMIAAVNGPATVHAELAVLCDIVLASETAEFADAPHFPLGVVPGDGVHVIWPMLLGPNRGRYFLLTGERLSAQQAIDLGVVSEVLEPGRLLPRAFELAHELLHQPPRTRRYTRHLLTHDIRRRLADSLSVGVALEGLSATEHWPAGRFSWDPRSDDGQ